MTGYTSPDNLPFPDDYGQPADTPTVMQALAAATQAALDGHANAAVQVLAGAGLTGGGDLSTSRTLNVGAGSGISVAADEVAVDTNVIASRGYADGKVTNALGSSTTVAPSQSAVNAGLAGKAAASHGHVPSQVGIRSGAHNFGTVNAGAQAEVTLGKNANERSFVTVNHPSSFIVAHVEEISATQFKVEVRNTTSGTNHTNVIVNYLLVAGA